MNDASIDIPYNDELERLETVLAPVRRPGSFFVHGACELAMPRVEVTGVGVLAFPLLDTQVKTLVEHAEQAPYGRGEETIIDTSVRRVWQILPQQVSISGKSWPQSFAQILSCVTEGLGCGDEEVSAELYKMLVYDEGDFFASHRDTEKADGMFGTLVVVLPSSSQGGELIVRHQDKEVTLDLAAEDVSEFAFAAFYADCEHEIKPVIKGARTCLIYNLIQRRRTPRLTAPDYEPQVAQATQIIDQTFTRQGAPAKLAWLLGHHYSPTGLSWAALKGGDAALAGVLRQAAMQARCVAHLGIVHIVEEGIAEPIYYDRGGGEGFDFEADDEHFDVIEAYELLCYIDTWVDPQDNTIDFGPLPVTAGEILPFGALDDEAPDESRLMEATGNEGASYERAYHRVALLIWREDRFADVLLQAGVNAVLPYLNDRIQQCIASSTNRAERRAVIEIANRVITAWRQDASQFEYFPQNKPGDRAEMLRQLQQLGDMRLVRRFIRTVITSQYGRHGKRDVRGSRARAWTEACRCVVHDADSAQHRLVSYRMRQPALPPGWW